MDSYRWTRAEIDLDALRHNIAAFRRMLGPRMRIMAVVKANAYGHGALKIAEEAVDCGVDYLAVAFLDEALELRRHGIRSPILVLGYTPPSGVPAALEHDVTLTVFDHDLLRAAAARDSGGKPLKIHIKIDTGMGRIGLADEAEAVRFIEEAIRTPGIEVEGVYTHYACADESDKTYTLRQHATFTRIVEAVQGRVPPIPLIHAGNSAAGIDTPELACNMVRLGVAMYGLYPSDEVRRDRVALKPVMSLKTGIVYVKRLPAGRGISYGANYVTQRDGERIATLPVGYADGYSRLLTGKAEVLVGGRRVPVVGNICMDQCMIRLPDDLDAKVGDEVVLFGSQGGETITADELAKRLGTINYEITCMVSNRVPRVYLKGGRVVQVDNPLLSPVTASRIG